MEDKVGTWIQSFLNNHLQAVRIGSCLSSWKNILSGVPQGSVIGSLLFLIYIADLGEDNSDTSVVKKFVDDTKVIASIENEESVSNLQNDLEKLYIWQSSNNMEYNDSKFQIVKMGDNRELSDDNLLFTPDVSDPIEEVECAKDLGILR